jgi:adenylylsulfate kinase
MEINLYKNNFEITRKDLEEVLNQKGFVIWMTGLSGSGKSTISNRLQKRLIEMNKISTVLDGDNIRMGLCSGLSFTEEGRRENIRRVSEVSKLFLNTGIITIVSLISPFESDRKMAKDIIGSDNFIELYVSTSLEICEKRDVKGLYKKARSGEIKNFTGIGSSYEPPKNADIIIDDMSIEESVNKIINYLKSNGNLEG